MTRSLALLLALTAPALAEPRLQDVLSAVTLSFGNDGATDRAVLSQNDDGGADLSIFRNVPAPGDAKTPAAPALFKTGVVFAGQAWGTLPSLSVNARGSLVVTSQNDAVGRDRWTQTLTIVLRDGAFVIAGLTYAGHDTLDPNAGHSCDLNLLSGKGTLDGKPFPGKLAPIPLAEWSDEKLPKACQM